MISKVLSTFFRSAATPPDTVIYVTGDIHGYLDAVMALDHKIDEHRKSNPAKNVIEIKLGDYVNRGPHSKHVIDYMIDRSRRNDGVLRVFLKGNHEVFFENFLVRDYGHGPIPDNVESFLNHGGLETLASYGVTPKLSNYREGNESNPTKLGNTNYNLNKPDIISMQREMLERVPASHLLFLERLKTKFELGSYVFVHAGIDPELPLKQQLDSTMMGLTSSVRKFVQYKGKIEDDKVIVHGHMVSDKPYTSPNQIGVDTGVYRRGMGRLSCAILNGTDVKFLQTATQMPPYDPKASLAATHMRAFANL